MHPRGVQYGLQLGVPYSGQITRGGKKGGSSRTGGKASTTATEVQAGSTARDAALQEGAKAAAGAAGTIAVDGLLTAAGVSGATMNPIGWAIAGGLLAAAGIAAITYHFTNAGRKAAMAEAEKWGLGGKAFAREYVKFADKATSRIQQRMVYLRGRIANKQAKSSRWFVRYRTDRIKELIDRYNAGVIILGLRQAKAAKAAIAGEPATAATAAVGEGAPDLPEWAPWVAGGVVGLVLLGAVAYAAKGN